MSGKSAVYRWLLTNEVWIAWRVSFFVSVGSGNTVTVGGYVCSILLFYHFTRCVVTIVVCTMYCCEVDVHVLFCNCV